MNAPTPPDAGILVTMKTKGIHNRFVRIWLLCGAAMLSAACDKISDQSIDDANVRISDVATWTKDSPKSYLVIDGRDAKSYAAGHIPNARRMETPEIDARDPDPRLREYKGLIVYGQNPGSGASRALAKRLLIAGYKPVYYMDEGFDGWKAKGLPVTSSEPAPAAKP